jgi:hypothetical protein
MFSNIKTCIECHIIKQTTKHFPPRSRTNKECRLTNTSIHYTIGFHQCYRSKIRTSRIKDGKRGNKSVITQTLHACISRKH